MKVFLAGTFGEVKHTDILKDSPYLLESFYYVSPWQYNLLKSRDMFFLDSGAFTFFSADRQIDWGEYIERYIAFINEHDVRYFFELDIDSIIGYDKVKKYRYRIEKQTNKQCIPVWHKSRGIDEYKRLADEYSYIAVGGIVSREIKPKEYKFLPSLIREAHRRDAKVHGMGFTNIKLFDRIRFDSVDSTRWNCARFGRLEYFDGKSIKTVDKRGQGVRLKTKETDVTGFTLTEWIKFQKYADTHL